MIVSALQGLAASARTAQPPQAGGPAALAQPNLGFSCFRKGSQRRRCGPRASAPPPHIHTRTPAPRAPASRWAKQHLAQKTQKRTWECLPSPC